MSTDIVRIEVNGTPLEARKGEMLIQVTDRAGIYVPRFCYHEKLTVAANCRMCLVEQEKAPKPVPACATPVADGMKFFTRSPRAIAAQRATMEFLLINHPLDCPICDQGGECELQDLALGFGRDVSRYTEKKRVVPDPNLGPLISTDMTRCIQCTRCVRFTAEIGGYQELGAFRRGEHMEIGTYIERNVDHELSGNVIDLCPVGALNSKPFRFRARAWEMTQKPTVSPHDCVGSNLYAHVLRGRLMRVVPRANEEINETWISDRDRYSYEGIYAADRLKTPLVRDADGWHEAPWDIALARAAQALREAGSDLATLASPSSTVEELYLLQKLVRALGARDIDHRVRMLDFRDDAQDPVYPSLGLPIQDLEAQDAILVVGSNLRREAPILAHRVRKAALRGAHVSFVNPARFEYLFPVASYVQASGAELVPALAALVRAAASRAGREPPQTVRDAAATAASDTAADALVDSLRAGARSAVLLGALASRHPAFADIRALAAALAELTGSTLGQITEGANAAGAYLAGAVPHRGPAGRPLESPGRDARAMLAEPRPAYLLLNLEPEADCIDPQAALAALKGARAVVALTPYASDAARDYARVLLPVATFAETSGTFVNCEGRWQSFAGVATPVGEARPAWKVLRVLGNLLDLAGFEHASSEDVRAELEHLVAGAGAGTGIAPAATGTRVVSANGRGGAVLDLPMYAVDALVRRAPALQATRDGRAQPALY
jgi:NADH-quinone oxidoreductase subunit G